MSPVTRRAVPSGTGLRRSLVVAAVVFLVAACGPAIDPVSFDPATPCTTREDEGRFAGAYPELEAILPTSFEGAAPAFRDSGRTCTPEQLGTLRERGITEVHFAGANWDLGNGRALTVAVFEATDLDPGRMIEFYEAGARAARRTNDLLRSDTTVGGFAAKRLDVLFGDSRQSIVAWGDDPPSGRVKVLLASELGDEKVAEVLQLLGTSSVNSPSPGPS
jgi:hypothetical protein